MERLSPFLRRLLIVVLVGLFSSVSVFIEEASADVTLPSPVCPKENTETFENPQFAYADKGGITLDATKSSFQLGSQTFDGYLYGSTYYDENGKKQPLYTSYTPPTIRVSSGKSIDLTLTNDLPISPNPQIPLPPTQQNLENQSQDTNLHYHGFGVSPLLGSDDVVMHVHSNQTANQQDKGGYYPGDAPPNPEYEPITEYPMHVDILENHSGLFWYHPHVHTVSDTQIRAGMSGGIIVEGFDRYYPISKNIPPDNGKPITEQVMLFKDFNDVLKSDPNKTYNCFTLNGQVNPKMTIKPGEVQFWRIGNIGADTYLNLQLLDSKDKQKQVPLYILARDSNNITTHPIETTGPILVPPASRVELLVVGGDTANETYNLVSQLLPEFPQQPVYQLATVQVEGNPVKYNTGGKALDKFITEQTPAKDDKTLPILEELAKMPYCKGSIYTKDCVIEPSTDKKSDLYRTFTFDSAILNDPKQTVVSRINAKLYDENRIDTVATLHTNEEWTLINADAPVGTSQPTPHAFHIHQLDFIVTDVTLPPEYLFPKKAKDQYPPVTNDKPYDNNAATCIYQKKNLLPLPNKNGDYEGYVCKLTQNGYRDTINLPLNSITKIRIPFSNPSITGTFVYHCHILIDEDTGMMQNIKVIDPLPGKLLKAGTSTPPMSSVSSNLQRIVD
ncbi:MAG: multicopper oxidase domain-containing protein [Symploca sp. SIO2B6]|nr:multicopper oxidase domain-containing protein [Symploca sp. SIO2B6]